MFAAIFQPNFVLLGLEFLFLFHLQQRMRISFVQRIIAFGLALFLISCNQEENYVPIVESPVSVDLTQVPYPNLSEYKFFDGPLKELKPAVGLLSCLQIMRANRVTFGCPKELKRVLFRQMQFWNCP